MGQGKGENLERERESTEMETPVRKKQINDTLSEFEESPVFNFINSLSPLKTVNSLLISQRFNSFSFPSVTSVFTSPQICPTKGTESLKEHHVSNLSTINSLSDEEKENYAVDIHECSESTKSGLDPMPCGGVQTKCLPEGALRPDVSLAQEPSMIRDVKKIEEGSEGDWERLISNTDDFLIFGSPNDTDSVKGSSLCKSLMSEFTVENTNELQNTLYADPNTVKQCETKPSAELVDAEPFPNFQRAVRRRCLVYEMGETRKKQLESSSSGPIMLSQYNSETDSIGKHLNGSGCCVLPGIGLHLNALAKTPNNNCFAHEKQSLNNYSSYRSQLSVGPGQNHFDQSVSERAVENGIPGLEDADQAFGYIASEDINQISPKKKRRKMESDGDNEGCKRCNCKKSKCLKLYCECFAAGVYCVEPCTCQECFNKPIHEEIVLAARKQIETRNPLAFAPKVVRSSESAPETRDDTSTTPASARHKRGCNCKKSGCLKKYCECYQEGVGCSINCRCEGCKNAFGTKDGSIPIGAEPQVDEEETEVHEKINESIRLPATPRLARALVQLNQSQSASFAAGSSSEANVTRNFENTSFLQPQLEFEKQNEAIRKDELPEILQENYSLGFIKSSSPNSKRVSPPHPSLKRSPNRNISRKLVLQSIHSFPALTPKQ